jgi:hypothetical protein
MKLKYIGSTFAILGLMAGTSALAALTVPPVSLVPAASPGAPDPQAVADLVERFRNILAGFTVDAAQQDIEAALMFEADQSGQSQAVVTAALEQVLVGQSSRVASNALALILSAQRRAAGQGTGAISGDEALDLFGDDTGPPVVLGGGADSDYSI